MISFNDFGRPEFESFADAQKHIEKIMLRHNETPVEELGGLSPEQAHRLLYAEWDSAASPLKIVKTLPPAKYLESPFVRQTRTFLLKLRDANGVKPTQTGNLPRAFVRTLIDDYLEGERKSLFLQMNKVVNEMDLFQLHVSRVVCEAVNLIGKSKGRFVVRKKSLRLLENENAGELFAVLFLAFFRRFNLQYLAVWNFDLGFIQHRFAYSLWRLHAGGDQWFEAKDRPELLLANDRERLEDMVRSNPYLKPADLLFSMVSHPLLNWGFLEFRDPEELFKDKVPVRPTKMFREVIQFDFKGAETA